MTLLMFILGLALLIFGAEMLVRGASQIGLTIGISPLVVGLVIVAYGTSSPELSVAVRAVLSDHPDIIIGTCIGSTIFNIFAILGLSACVAPLVVAQNLVRREVPIMIGVYLLLLWLCLDGMLSRWDALILFLCGIAYTIFTIYNGRKESEAILEEYQSAMPPVAFGLLKISKETGLIIAGLFFCVIGSGWLLESAVDLAQMFGVSELVISITIIGAATSLPELATSVMATIRGQRDIAIGNVVGSNIFNILIIIGVAGLIAPEGIIVAPAALTFDLPVAIAACVACLPIFFTGHMISRWEGVVFLGYYAAYTSYLILAAKEHDALPMFSMIMLWFVIPLTFLTLGIIAFRQIRKRGMG